ncbi:N-acyl homoserine lactonase family protein [Nocardioides houyundeii]|uniref:N-acyl homoserine lactonase family protein n=1 Tax=Nocardioides houyundeii TaxID=2045452 RepID=UPI000DF1C278|nr:N-acyl homoserine lactonase family protein [Nocardioides houyundeii]
MITTTTSLSGLGQVEQLWALEGATFTLDRSRLMAGGQGELVIPVPSFLMRHERGLVLWDTGVSPLAQEDPIGYYGVMGEQLQIHYPEGNRVDRQIERLGFSVSDVTHVVISHSHFDHAGGLYLFPHAEIYAGAGDVRYAMWPDSHGARAFRREDLEPTRGWKWHEVHGDHDLFGDGSIILLWLPGHTPGNLSLLVRTPEGPVILSGDTVHLQEAVDGGLPAPNDWDSRLAKVAARRLGLLRDSLEARLWVCHDPSDWKRFTR